MPRGGRRVPSAPPPSGIPPNGTGVAEVQAARRSANRDARGGAGTPTRRPGNTVVRAAAAARRFFQMVTAPFGGPGQPPNRTVRPGGSRGGGPAPQNVRPGGSRGGRSAYGGGYRRAHGPALPRLVHLQRQHLPLPDRREGLRARGRAGRARRPRAGHQRRHRLAGTSATPPTRGPRRSWPSTATSTPTSRGRSTTSCSTRTCSSPSTPATCGPCAGSRPTPSGCGCCARSTRTPLRGRASRIRTTAGRRGSPRCSR